MNCNWLPFNSANDVQGGVLVITGEEFDVVGGAEVLSEEKSRMGMQTCQYIIKDDY